LRVLRTHGHRGHGAPSRWREQPALTEGWSKTVDVRIIEPGIAVGVGVTSPSAPGGGMPQMGDVYIDELHAH
jgi:hypothetical protein